MCLVEPRLSPLFSISRAGPSHQVHVAHTLIPRDVTEMARTKFMPTNLQFNLSSPIRDPNRLWNTSIFMPMLVFDQFGLACVVLEYLNFREPLFICSDFNTCNFIVPPVDYVAKCTLWDDSKCLPTPHWLYTRPNLNGGIQIVPTVSATEMESITRIKSPEYLKTRFFSVVMSITINFKWAILMEFQNVGSYHGVTLTAFDHVVSSTQALKRCNTRLV